MKYLSLMILVMIASLVGCGEMDPSRPGTTAGTDLVADGSAKVGLVLPDVAMAAFSAAPASVRPGEVLELSATVNNVSSLSTDPFQVRVVEPVSGRVLVRRFVNGLGPFEGVSGTALLSIAAKDFSAVVPPGTYTLVAIHDLPDLLPENNSMSIEVEVLPEDFSFQLTVFNPQGNPQPRLLTKLHVPIPEMDPMKPATSIRFSLVEEAEANLAVYDLEGDLVRTLIDGFLAAGEHAVVFDGRNDSGEVLLGTCVLRYELICTDPTGAEVFRDSKVMTLYTGIDYQQRPILGTTDEQGMVSTDDKLLFPFLYELPGLVRTNENGETIGFFTISNLVTISLEIESTVLDFEFEIGPGANHFVLGPQGDLHRVSPVPLGSGTGGFFQVQGGGQVHLGDKRGPEWTLRQNYPNPFN